MDINIYYLYIQGSSRCAFIRCLSQCSVKRKKCGVYSVTDHKWHVVLKENYIIDLYMQKYLTLRL